MTGQCVFCDIVNGVARASIVLEDDHTLCFVDLRQANPGHVLVIPKTHIHDVRDLDSQTGAALMRSVTRVTKAVGTTFPNDGISLWHSIGPAAFQEVPHLHIHVHPRLPNDNILRVYQELPGDTDNETRDRYAVLLRHALGRPPA